MRAVVVLIETVSVFDTASAGAGGVEVATGAGSVVGGVVVAACGELEPELVAVGGEGSAGGGVGSGSGVANVVKVSSAVMAALPPESITMTR